MIAVPRRHTATPIKSVVDGATLSTNHSHRIATDDLGERRDKEETEGLEEVHGLIVYRCFFSPSQPSWQQEDGQPHPPSRHQGRVSTLRRRAMARAESAPRASAMLVGSGTVCSSSVTVMPMPLSAALT